MKINKNFPSISYFCIVFILKILDSGFLQIIKYFLKLYLQNFRFSNHWFLSIRAQIFIIIFLFLKKFPFKVRTILNKLYKRHTLQWNQLFIQFLNTLSLKGIISLVFIYIFFINFLIFLYITEIYKRDHIKSKYEVFL